MQVLLTFSLAIFSFFQSQTFTPFTENGKIGLKDEQGIIVIPASYEALGWSDGTFSIKGQLIGYKKNGTWGLISVRNEIVTPNNYVSLIPARNYFIATKQSPSLRLSTGCLSIDGKELIPFNYTDLVLTESRLIAVMKDNHVFKYGLIDFDNNIVIPIQHKSITPLGSLRYAVENFESKIAIYSESGKAMTPFAIDSISEFQFDHARIYQQGFTGLIHRTGTIVAEAKYSEIQYTKELRSGRLPDQWFQLDETNKTIRSIQASDITSLNHNRFSLTQQGFVQLVDEKFQSVALEKFSVIYPYQDQTAIACAKACGVIDWQGHWIVQPTFDTIKHSGDYFIAQRDYEQFLISMQGARISKSRYQQIHPFNGSFFPVVKNGFWGGINLQGEESIACVYDSILDVKENLVAVKFRNQFGIIDTDENWKVTPQSNPISLINATRYFEYASGMRILKSLSGYTYYFTTNPITLFDDYLEEQTSTGAIWTINYDGQIIKRQEPHSSPVEEIFPASQGLRGIKKDGRYGFIDDRGRLRIANRYEAIKPFSSGLAAVKIRNKWGFINTEDQIVVQPVYEEVFPFDHGFARVQQNGLSGLIDTKGKLVLPARYQRVDVLPTGRLLIMQNEFVGLADREGNILLQPKFESITDLNNGFLLVKQNNQFGVINLDGITVIPIVYDDLRYNKNSNSYLALKKSSWIKLP